MKPAYYFIGLTVIAATLLGSFHEQVFCFTTAQSPAGTAYREAYSLVLAEQWQPASSALGAFLQTYPESDWSDDAGFWLCYAKERIETPEAAFGCYQDFLDRVDESDWEDDARHNLVGLAHQLARTGKPEYEEYVREYGHSDEYESGTALTALAALSDIGDETSLQVIIQRFDATENEQLRSHIVEILGDHAENPVVGAKLREIARSDSSTVVRMVAIEGLGDLENGSAFELLKEIALSEEPAEVRAVAVEVMGDLEDDRVFPFLKQLALENREAAIAISAVYGLEHLEDPQKLSALREIFEGSDKTEVRLAALDALASEEYGKNDGLSFFRGIIFNQSDPEIRLAAIHALEDFESPDAVEILKDVVAADFDTGTRVSALYAIAYIAGDEGVGILKKSLAAASEATMRKEIVRALGETEMESAVPVLTDVARNDPNSEVRRSAVSALGEIGSETARAALIDLLQEGIE